MTAVRPRRVLINAGVLAALGASVPLAGCTRRGFHATDVTGAEWGRDFRLRDPEGRVRTLADFRGRAVLIFFGFTQCPDVCPTALTRATEVMQALGDDARELQVIFVTVDPERDTPALLREYTSAFHPDFLGLWGDEQETAAAAAEFKVIYMKVPTNRSYTIDHTALSYVFDRAGRLRLAVRHGSPASELAEDVKQLLRQG